MPRLDRLPPPQPSPKVSPPVTVDGESETRVPGLAGGPSLEVRVHIPQGKRVLRSVLLCHPHPLYGGTMHSPVPLAIAKRLSEAAARDGAALAWARFDFRGVGTSEGAYDGGKGEVEDVRAVLAHLRAVAPGAPISVCGHSFGSWVGLRAAAAEGGVVDRVLLVAPSSRFFGFDEDARAGLRFSGKTSIFIGTDDDFCDVDEARALGEELGADVRVFDGFDHHFLKSRRAMAEAALPVIAPEVMV
ncbi:MAG: alpha/beta fold hydrolase [Myxococcales bacterium]|nr:alpha/beta fold hydrolase [Myxococcales bacterium]